MSIYSSMQICGEPQITIERRDGIVWVGIKDGNQAIWMEAQHVRALETALDRFEAAEADARVKLVADMVGCFATMPASVIAVDAAEPAGTAP